LCRVSSSATFVLCAARLLRAAFSSLCTFALIWKMHSQQGITVRTISPLWTPSRHPSPTQIFWESYQGAENFRNFVRTPVFTLATANFADQYRNHQRFTGTLPSRTATAAFRGSQPGCNELRVSYAHPLFASGP
jgi:hypothetical protein